MADWYIAPDALVKTGLTFGTIGIAGYGHSWGAAVKWSQFQTASGCWVNRAANDVFHFLSGAKEYKISNAAGWAQLVWNQSTLRWLGETLDGIPSPVIFCGTRDWPWPRNGQSPTYAGETFAKLSTSAANPYLSMIHFRNMAYCLSTTNTSSATDYGQVQFDDCVATNTFGGLFTTQSTNDGRSNLIYNRCRQHGYAGSTGKVFANNSGHSVDLTDCFGDSEHQNDNLNPASAHSTSLANVWDSIAGQSSVKAPATVTRVVAINHAAGLNASGSYQQGDGLIFEENTGTVTVHSLLTWGNGDRGLDAKCAGTVQHMISLGDGTGGVGHHMDSAPMKIYNAVLRAGARLTVSTSSSKCQALQSSGWTQAFMSWLSARPTATQVAARGYSATAGSIDPTKTQHMVVGSTHVGNVQLYDCVEVVGTTAGAVEANGYTTSSYNGRFGWVFGLTASTAYNFKVRACAQNGSASAYTADIPYTMGVAGGDVTGPASAPTGLAATPQTGGSDIVFTWNQVAEDAGVGITGYCMFIDFGDGAGYLPTYPLKTASPLRLNGFKPATAYSVKIAAVDLNGNMGTLSGAVSVTTASGSTSTSTPSVPLNVGVDREWSIFQHPSVVALGLSTGSSSATWTACATGTAAYYEIADSGTGLVVARCLQIPSVGSNLPLTKQNTLLVTV